MSIKGKKTRRCVSLAASGVLLIALSACSGSSNTYGMLTGDEYAKCGEYQVTDKELWDELKWDSKDVLTTQINNVVVDKYIKNITNVMNNEFSKLSDDDKTALSITDEAGFNSLKEKYSDRLVDYVIQDIYNFNYKNKNYEENLELLDKTNKKKSEVSYVDEMYSTYRITKIGDKELIDLIKVDEPYEYKENYLTIANDSTLRQVYYALYARELLAFAKKTEDVKTADDEDTDEEDEKWGYYTNSNYVASFKSQYTYTYDVNAIIIKFTNDDEFNNTLRAFGIKIYKNTFWYVKDSKENMTYQEYVDYYDELSNSSLMDPKAVAIPDNAVLEVYVQLYNYMYGGYRQKLSTGNSDYDISNYDLNTLRTLTSKILSDYTAKGSDNYYDNGVKHLIETYGGDDSYENDTKTVFKAEDLEKLSTSFKTLVYETMEADGSKKYSTSTTSANDASYIAFKLGNKFDTAKNKAYEEFYNKDLTEYDILTFIKNTDGLKKDIEEYLIKEDISDSAITTFLNTEIENVKVKIYNEACEIAYLQSNSNYSKTVGSNSDKNVLATIEYDDKKYNLDIVANKDDENAVKVVGTNDVFGVYNYLETKDGVSTAIDLITKKMIKKTNAYEETNKDRDEYEKNIQILLLNFANDGLSSSGYSSTIGKYNFLMLYFHSADIDQIIDDYYRVQFASSKLLTNYASDDLAKFVKEYTDNSYDNYFSLTATRLVVYFDGDEDNEYDDVTDWKDKVVENIKDEKFKDFNGKTFEYVAKHLVYEIYKKLSSSTTAHADELTTIVDEINKTAKFQYEDNPILSENLWSIYRHLGLYVKTEEVTVTNSSLDVDFNIKSRLYNYSKGSGDIVDDDGNVVSTANYQYFVNGTAPTAYIENLTDTCVDVNNDYIVETKDGYNLLLVTQGNSKPSAKYKKADDTVGLLNNIVIKYNDKYDTVIKDVYNDEDKLGTNQIQLYMLDYISNNASTLAPTSINDAITTFLAPIVTRYTSSETQRIILLSFIRNKTGLSKDTELYDVVKFKNTSYNGEDGVFAKIIKINQNIADDYLNYPDLYNDPTGTANLYPDWWNKIKSIVDTFLQADNKEEK